MARSRAHIGPRDLAHLIDRGSNWPITLPAPKHVMAGSEQHPARIPGGTPLRSSSTRSCANARRPQIFSKVGAAGWACGCEVALHLGAGCEGSKMEPDRRPCRTRGQATAEPSPTCRASFGARVDDSPRHCLWTCRVLPSHKKASSNAQARITWDRTWKCSTTSSRSQAGATASGGSATTGCLKGGDGRRKCPTRIRLQGR